MNKRIISPCISICKTDPLTGYCYGCARTDEEKKTWKNESTNNHWKEENLYTPLVVIVGPDDTPYEKGFYCIKFKFTEKFPFEPPKATFLTTDGHVRMNPNLYASGKICLSLLGTWSGPQWTSCQNLSTIILSLLMIMHENPIQNEPGYQNTKIDSKRNQLYNLLLIHANIRVGVLQMIQTPPIGFACFTPILKKLFLEYYDFYETVCRDNMDTEYKGKQKSPIYKWVETVSFKKLQTQLQELKKNLNKK